MPTRHEADTRLLLSIAVLQLDDAGAGCTVRRPSVDERLLERLGPELHARLRRARPPARRHAARSA
jgi:hypothetical protein